MTRVDCHFSDSGNSRVKHSQCQNAATSFVRNPSNRLVPLCDYCRGIVMKIVQERKDLVVTDVPLSDMSIAEFRKQPKKGVASV